MTPHPFRKLAQGTWLDTPNVNASPSDYGLLPPAPALIRAVDATPWHSRPVFDGNLSKLAHWAASEVKRANGQAVVALGHSGLVLAGAVGLLADVPVFAVRRKGERTVSGEGNEVTGYAPNGPVDRWVFLDDFISSGGTFYHCARAVYEVGLAKTPLPAAIVTYRDAGRHPTAQRFAGSTLRREIGEGWPWPELVDIPLRVYPGHRDLR